MLRESKAMLPKLHFFSVFNTLCSTTTYINLPEAAAELAAAKASYNLLKMSNALFVISDQLLVTISVINVDQ